MSKTEAVQKAMVAAMKAHDGARKTTLSLLLSALKAKAKDKRAELTAEEEDAIVMREIKQTQETLDSARGREDIVKECEDRLAVLEEFAPKMMDEGEIRAVIEAVLAAFPEPPTAKQKGLVMRELMPKVKGKADGGLVNRLVSEYLKS